MSKVVCFGEIMLRLQPYNYERFIQAERVQFSFGGAEANVAVSLANFGVDIAYVTKLPSHMVGQAAINSLRRYGVDTSKVVRGVVPFYGYHPGTGGKCFGDLQRSLSGGKEKGCKDFL